MERVPMTPEGFEKLRLELKHMKSVVRPQNIKDIEEARAHGDLSENAEYHAAKEKQSVIAAQINALENKVSLAEVIDPASITETSLLCFFFFIFDKLFNLNRIFKTFFFVVINKNFFNNNLNIFSRFSKSSLNRFDTNRLSAFFGILGYLHGETTLT